MYNMILLQSPSTYLVYTNFFNTVKPWNELGKNVVSRSFSIPISFMAFRKRKYFALLGTVYDAEFSCTWSLVCECPYHRTSTVPLVTCPFPYLSAFCILFIVISH